MRYFTDFHSHILPEIDDGSSSVEESLAMLQAERDQGIKSVVATPHFYAHHDSPERFLKRRAAARQRLLEAVPENMGLPEMVMGAEVHFFSGMSEIDCLQELTISNSKCLLVEMPHGQWTEMMYRELEGMYVNHGVIPIIAHVDRYISPLQTHGIPERLSDLPVLVQANAGFFLNRWTEGMAIRMLKKGQIQLLGSDCHNMRSRPPRLGEALAVIQKRTPKDMLNLLERNAQRVFEDAFFQR